LIVFDLLRDRLIVLVEFRPKDFSVIWWVRWPERKLRIGG